MCVQVVVWQRELSFVAELRGAVEAAFLTVTISVLSSLNGQLFVRFARELVLAKSGAPSSPVASRECLGRESGYLHPVSAA